MNGQKTAPDFGIHMPEPATADDWNVSRLRRRSDVAHAIVRLLCLLSSATAMALMMTAEERATIPIYGLNLPVYSKWSFSNSFEYLVGMSAAAAAHSLLQLVLSLVKLLKKSPVICSRNRAWFVFAGDQVFALAMMSAGSAASGVNNLNRTGIQHTSLPNFCKPLRAFCDRVAISVAFTFFSCFLLVTSVVFDVIRFSKF